MAITCKSLSKVTFPAYPLPNDSWRMEDGILFFESFVLDDKNMSGATLGIRRLQSPFSDNLYPLKKGVANIIGMSKNPASWYIDSKGLLFEYEKSIYCTVKYHYIERIERKGTCSLLYLKGINRPFKVPRPPDSRFIWAGVMYYKGHPWLLYDYSQSKNLDKKRKI